jgi:NADPH:quinone reductase-like Zn-dependent oxidoreductase
MSTQRAVVHKEKGVFEIRDDVPLPRLRDEYILVKTKAVALNPTDWKGVEGRPAPGAIAGCDYAGVVEEIGSKVTTPFKVGDRVAGICRGGISSLPSFPLLFSLSGNSPLHNPADPNEHENGAFAQHISVKGDIQIKITDNISFEDAATLGVGLTTVGQAMYQTLGLPLPPAKVTEPTTILIYGGSTATGTLAIQYAKLYDPFPIP